MTIYMSASGQPAGYFRCAHCKAREGEQTVTYYGEKFLCNTCAMKIGFDDVVLPSVHLAQEK